MAQQLNPPVPETQVMQVQSLGQEELLEKEMATHPSILAWKIPWTIEPGGYSHWAHKNSDTTEHEIDVWRSINSWIYESEGMGAHQDWWYKFGIN